MHACTHSQTRQCKQAHAGQTYKALIEKAGVALALVLVASVALTLVHVAGVALKA